MKKIIYISLLCLVFVSCGRRHKKVSAHKNEERVEIIPFYQNSIEISDLHLLDTNLILVEPQEFMDASSRQKLIDAIWAVIRNPGSKIYFDSPQFTKPATYRELMDRWTQCDSVVMVDSLDNRLGPATWMCDSTALIDGIQRITFFESWYRNTRTNMIEKELLGYCAWQYVADKEAYRMLFNVFPDEKAVEKAKKYYFYY